VVLEDDKHYFPPYEAVPVVNRRAFERHPALREMLSALGGKITAEEMRLLNYAVDGEHRDVKDVVHDFLESRKL
jgi:osmoprotectant transport system substrate-binding protein